MPKYFGQAQKTTPMPLRLVRARKGQGACRNSLRIRWA